MQEFQVPSRCCRVFVIPDLRDGQNLRDRFRRTLRDLREGHLSPEGVRSNVEDLRTFQLLRPLRWRDVTPDVRRTVTPDLRRSMLYKGLTTWTCKYIDPETGSCGIYEHRPGMCRTFPANDAEGNVTGHNTLCYACSSTYCQHHPETLHAPCHPLLPPTQSGPDQESGSSHLREGAELHPAG